MEKGSKLDVGEAVEKIKRIDREGNVQFVILYGSAAGGSKEKPSDVDLAIGHDGGKRERFEFRISISGELPGYYDVQIYQDLPLYLKKEVLKGEVLYCRNFRELHDLALETIRDYEFFEPNFLDYIRG